MDYIPNELDQEPAMRFEGIGRYAFDCKRAGDPNGIADAGVFDGEFIPTITKEGLKIMNIILDELIVKETPNKKNFVGLKESLTKDIEQENAIDLVDYIIKLIKEDLEQP